LTRSRPAGILLHHGVAPQATHDAVERHLLFGREGSQLQTARSP
jgi:hypothetical protein